MNVVDRGHLTVMEWVTATRPPGRRVHLLFGPFHIERMWGTASSFRWGGSIRSDAWTGPGDDRLNRLIAAFPWWHGSLWVMSRRNR